MNLEYVTVYLAYACDAYVCDSVPSLCNMNLEYVTMYLAYVCDYVSSLCNSASVLAEEPSPCFRG